MCVTLPSRFTTFLMDLLGQEWGFHIYLSSHYNHVRELTETSRSVLKSLKKRGVTLLNQSVLLRGVNDSAQSLSDLFQNLYELGVLPFYLHHPDWTPGTFHFRSSIQHGISLMNQLKGRITGPALPEYVLDLPQGFGKISLVNSNFFQIRAFASEDGIAGALYEAYSPNTRQNASLVPNEPKRRVKYLDLYFE